MQLCGNGQKSILAKKLLLRVCFGEWFDREHFACTLTIRGRDEWWCHFRESIFSKEIHSVLLNAGSESQDGSQCGCEGYGGHIVARTFDFLSTEPTVLKWRHSDLLCIFPEQRHPRGSKEQR